MASNRLIWHPEAFEEAEQARAWYLERSPLAARGFVVALEAAVDAVASTPQRWPKRHSEVRQYIFANRYPFTLVYRDYGDCILIVAVAHQSRRPEYWIERL